MVTMATGSVLPTSPVQLIARADLRVGGLAAGRWPNSLGFSENSGLDEGVEDGDPDACDVTVGGELPHAASGSATRIAHAMRTGRQFKYAHRAQEGANWTPDDRP